MTLDGRVIEEKKYVQQNKKPESLLNLSNSIMKASINHSYEHK